MIIRLLLAVSLFYSSGLKAQIVKAYPVKVGEIPDKVLPMEAKYLLPGFKEGKVLNRDGSYATGKFNYNFLLDEMHFIDTRGDTLAIANPELLKTVIIDSLSFYYDKGYLREIFRTETYRLAIRQQMVQIADKTRGGYDAPLAAGSIKTYGSVYNSGKIYQLQVKKDVLFQGEFAFYIANVPGPFVKADKKNFHIFFQEKNISKFTKEHKINFNTESDLKELLLFCVH